MYEKRRPNTGQALLIFILAAFVLAACGTQVAGNSWPGMAASGDVVYIAYGSGVMAVDIVEEEQLWTFFPEDAAATLQFYAEPSINDGRIILGDYGASKGFLSPGVIVSVYALDESDGNISEDWKQGALAKDRIIAAPVQAEGRVFVGTADNFILALDAETGELAWEKPFKAEHSFWSTPTYADGILYVGSLDKNIYAINAETGVQVWKRPLAGSVSGQVAVGDSLIYVGSFDKKLHAVDKENGEIRWGVPEGGTEDWVWAGPLLVDDVVYFADKSGHVFAVDGETGRSIWDTQVGGQVVASPVYADGIVFIASAGLVSNGDDIRRGAIIALDAETGEELWREETPAPIYTTPVIVQDMVVVALPPGAGDLLVVYNQRDGDKVWQYSLPAEE